MAQGDFTVFEEFIREIGEEIHNLSSDTLSLGLVDSTVTPTAADGTPRWADYSANDVSAAGNYVADGIDLTGVTWTEAGGTATLDDTGNIAIAQDGSGFTDARWGILYNKTAPADQAIGFLDLGAVVSEQAGPLNINWGAAGILTIAD